MKSSRDHDDIIKWKHFPPYWPFVQGIHHAPVNSLHKGQWHGALLFSFICAWISSWVNNREADDLRHHRAHYDVIVMAEIGFQSFLITLTFGRQLGSTDTWQYSKWYKHLNSQSLRYMTHWDLLMRHLTGYWNILQGHLLLTWINLNPRMDK